MSNNINVTEGTGKTVSTEDIGTQQYQRIKVVGGETGSTSVMGVNPDRSINVSVIGTVNIAGSVIAVVTSNPNQSISGASTAPPGSVMQVRTDNASVITVFQSSSLIAVPTGNQSISGAVTAPAGSIMQMFGSVAATQVTNPWIITGSVQTIGSMFAIQGTTPWATTQSGSVITVFQDSSIITINKSSSIIAVVTGSVALASSVISVPISSTIVVFQSSSLITREASSSIIAVVTGSVVTINQSSSIIGVVTGSVALASSVITVPTGSTIAYVQNSIAAVIVGGSIVSAGTQYLENAIAASVTGTAVMFRSNVTTSILSVVSPTTPLPVSVQGTVTALQGTTPWLTNQGGSIIAVIQGSSLISINAGSVFTTSLGSIITVNQSSSIIAVVTGSVALASSVISVPTGSVIVVLQSSSIITREASSSIIAVVTGSVALASSVISTSIGSIIAVVQSSSIIGVVTGSIALASSVISTSIGSVITIQQAQSIVGTYAEDAASTNLDKGLFVLGVRNDTLASISTADGDYTQFTVGQSGELITANSPITKWFSGQNSVMSGPSVQVIAAGGASIFNYITGVQIANDGGVFARIKFTGGLGSVLAWTVAPANGGSNIVFNNPLRTGENSGFSASVSAHSSVYVSAQGFTAKA